MDYRVLDMKDRWLKDRDGRLALPMLDWEIRRQRTVDFFKWAVIFVAICYLYGC